MKYRGPLLAGLAFFIGTWLWAWNPKNDIVKRERDLYAQVLAAAGITVTQAATAEQALQMIVTDAPDMVISDVGMPGASGWELLKMARERVPSLPFLLVTAYADVRHAVEALKLGAVDYLAKPVDLDELLACIKDTLGLKTKTLTDGLPADAFSEMVVASSGMQALMRDAWRIAQSDANVLTTGESGTGKEELARFLHRHSNRKNGPLVAVNCAALPANLLAAELFGHERGAFTGATGRRDRRFREAEGGTLFLDEIGDMPLELQPGLLRAIEQRTLTPLGATGETTVDFRLVAATNHHLEDDVSANRFRQDLFYRLNVIALHIWSLRERREDTAPLARKFLGTAADHGKRVSHAAMRSFLAYGWPGNVRELANAMGRARLLTRADVILPDNLPETIQRAGIEEDVGPEVPVATDISATDGNQTKAAVILGISRRGLIKKLKRFGIM